MKKINFTIPIVALITGAAIGFCLSPESSAPCQECIANAEKAKKFKSERPKRAIDSEGRSQRRRVREIDSSKTDAQEARVSERGSDEPRSPRQGSDWLNNLKTENPERYQQITNNMARWRSERTATVQSKLEFLSSIDTSKMPKHAKETHEKLLALYQEREAMEARIEGMMLGGAGSEFSHDDRRKMFEEMRETSQMINELAAQERENLIKQTAHELGFKGEDVGEITATIKGIIDATSTSFQMPRPPRMGDRPRMGGPR